MSSDRTNEMSPKRRKIRDNVNPNVTHPGGGQVPPLAPTLKIKLRNQFDNLSNQVDVPEPTGTPVKRKLPPIVVHGIFENHNETVKIIRRIIADDSKFWIKYGKNTSNIFTETLEAYSNLKKYLNSDSVDFHTFTRKDQKSHAFVLRGLNEEHDLEELKAELNEKNMDVQNVYIMKGMRNPAYLVITDQKITLNYLTQHVRVVNYTVVSWERHYSNKKITQCRRCQAWGHATSNCFSSPKCLKCAEGHLTIDCSKPKDTPAKCVNCNGDHPANYTKCITYQNLLEKLQERKNQEENKKPVKYSPAPLPKTNLWENRRRIQEEKKNARQFDPKEKEERPPKSTGEFGTFTEMKNELDKLNEFINISEFLLKIKNLNEKLARCKSGSDKFQIFYEFINNF